jgi:hypothetical protein
VDSPASYFNWSFISISLPNLALMAVMIVVFAAAVVLPFPFGHKADDPEPEDVP